MNISAPFIRRPVATTLLTIGIALAGLFAFTKLPVSPLPSVDFPTLLVQAQMPGASPETMATAVASPLERHLGQIADLSEITSRSNTGMTQIVLQFGLDRNIDGAARDVQAAINAARADLPSALRSNPTYRKFNPSDAPILIVALTSDTLTQGQIYDAASTVLQQKLSQVEGVGNVDIGGSSLPAVRVEINPGALFQYGVSLESVRAALAAANANSPKGALEIGDRHYQLYANDQARKAVDYRDLVVAYRNGAAIRLRDVADVIDSVEDVRNQGLSNGRPSVLLILYKQPGSNIAETVDRLKAVLPQMQAALPGDIQMILAGDRSTTIRASLADTERTLIIAVVLVVLVVFLFLRNAPATLIPCIVVPISIIGTFAAMYLLNYSLDNLSLMALTVATGFVVDDAIVVLENITRHLEDGMSRLQAALLGASEVGFTVVSMSVSLVAVFVPILLMGGIVGRLFQEFAVTLSLSIAISLVLSLTATPVMCAKLLKPHVARARGRLSALLEAGFDGLQSLYAGTLDSGLRRPGLVMLVLAATVALNGVLYVVVPKGFFPQQDGGLLIGGIQADQAISFQLMKQKLAQAQAIVQADPAVANVVGFTGGRGTNSANVFVTLKPLAQRDPAPVVIARLRPKLAQVAGANLVLFPVQTLRVGGRQSLGEFQYTLQADSTVDLYQWAPRLVAALQNDPALADVNSDQQQGGLESRLVVDRVTASRLGLTPQAIDNALYDAFGQRQASTIYAAMNQYHVIMELAPPYLQNPESLKLVRVSASDGSASGTLSTNAATGTVTASSSTSVQSAPPAATDDAARNQATNSIGNTGKSSASSAAAISTASETMIQLSAFAHLEADMAPTQVNHQGLFVATTISFSLAPGHSLSDATAAIARAESEIRMPASIHGAFAGSAATFQSSLSTQPWLILAALVTVYLVLGILYESYVHPITILSTLPSAGVGAVLALLLFKTDFSVIALIGVFLLIGIVKKNAIMMIDFALAAERVDNMSPRDAIRQACLLRFRPIMMTTCAALLGAVPLIVTNGEGAELRQPLGIAIIGGLIVSQMLTLYTTPVVYLYLDRFGRWVRGRRPARSTTS